MTVHLVTVGRSIRDELARRHVRDFALVRHEARGAELLDGDLLGVDALDRGDVRRFLTEATTGRDPGLSAAAATAWQRLGAFGGAGVSGWPATVSAESTSLSTERRRVRPAGDEMIVLLATDTVTGLLSAFWNAVHLAGGPDPLERIDFADHVSAPGLERRGRVRIQLLPDLDLTRPDRMNDAMCQLARFARGVLLSVHPAEEVVVHLSGGYKATIPFLIGIAEGMRSVKVSNAREPVAVRAVVVHEDSLAPGHDPVAVPIPLRRFKAKLLREELEPFTRLPRVRERDLVGGDALLGYAYDLTADGRSYTLTAFGHGLIELLGPLSEGGT